MASLWFISFFALFSTISGFWLNPEDRIISGRESFKNSHPFMVSIQDTTYPVIHFCGGSLINSRTVLTAAHCIFNMKTKIQMKAYEISVVLGAHNIDKPYGNEVKRGVRRVIRHTTFPNGKSKFDSDIALLILDKPVGYNDIIKPICLNSEELPMSKMTTIAGWGGTNYQTISSVLMETNLPIVDHELCAKKLKYFWYEPHQLCVGYPHLSDNFPDVCHGDSGGPAFIGSRDKPVQVGIVSFGSIKGCSIEGYPSGLTKVSAFIPWIIENSEGESICVE